MAWAPPAKVGDRDPLLPRARAHLSKFSYGAALKGTSSDTIDVDYLAAQHQFKTNVHDLVVSGRRAGPDVDPGSAAFDWATKKQMALLGAVVLAPPTQPFLYTFAGTWSHWDAGFQADLARMLPDTYQWQPCWYPASFGFINPPFPGAPSYADSVEQGVDEGVRLINLNPGRFALSGYSQGAEVVGRLCQELTTGRLRHRGGDVLGVATFGDPARQRSDRTVGDGKGAGISKLVIDGPGHLNRLTAAAKGDMYCTIPDGQVGNQMHAAYYALTRLGTGKIDGHAPILTEVMKIAADPLTGGMAVINAVIRAAQVSAHGTYGPLVPAAVDHLRAAARKWNGASR